MANGEIRQALNRDVSIQPVNQCDEPGCETVHVMSINAPHHEGETGDIIVDIIGVEISFGVPREALQKYLNTLRGKVPQKGCVKVKGIDANGVPHCYCLVVDSGLQWQLITQIGAYNGPQAFVTALGQWRP